MEYSSTHSTSSNADVHARPGCYDQPRKSICRTCSGASGGHHDGQSDILIKASGADSVLVADEPFRFLGTAQVPRASMLLKEIAQRLGVQVILTTHHDMTVDVADRAFLLQKTDDGVSVHTKE